MHAFSVSSKNLRNGQVPGSQVFLTEETVENYPRNQECVIQHLPFSGR